MRRAAALAVVVLLAAGCGVIESKESSRGRGDGPRFPTHKIDGVVADGITEMPDGFGNITTKCVWDGWRAFVGTKGKGASALFVVADPACKYHETGPDT